MCRIITKFPALLLSHLIIYPYYLHFFICSFLPYFRGICLPPLFFWFFFRFLSHLFPPPFRRPRPSSHQSQSLGQLLVHLISSGVGGGSGGALEPVACRSDGAAPTDAGAADADGPGGDHPDFRTLKRNALAFFPLGRVIRSRFGPALAPELMFS